MEYSEISDLLQSKLGNACTELDGRFPIAFSSDGTKLAMCVKTGFSSSSIIKIIDLATNETLDEFEVDGGPQGLALMPNHLAIRWHKSAKIFRIEKGKLKGGKKVGSKKDNIFQASFLSSPSGNLLAVGAANSIEVWHLPKMKRIVYDWRSGGMPVSFTSDEEKLIIYIGSRSYQYRYLNLRTNEIDETVPNQDLLYPALYSADRKLVAYENDSWTELYLKNTATNNVLFSLTLPLDSSNVNYHLDLTGRYFALSFDHSVWLVDIKKVKSISSIDAKSETKSIKQWKCPECGSKLDEQDVLDIVKGKPVKCKHCDTILTQLT